jgi:hypothetical protein
MRIETLPSTAQGRFARPAPPQPPKPEPDNAQFSPSTKVHSRSTVEKTAPATLASLLALQEDSLGAGSKPETKSPAQQVRTMYPDITGRTFGAAVSALASGRDPMPPPAVEVSDAIEEEVPPDTETLPLINVEPGTSVA